MERNNREKRTKFDHNSDASIGLIASIAALDLNNADKETLVRASRNDPGVTELLFSGFTYGDEICIVLSKILRSNKYVKKLDLSSSNVGIVGIKKVLSALVLEGASPVEEIDLSNNIFDDDEYCRVLKRMIVANKVIKSMNISCCTFENNSFKVLCEGLVRNDTLQNLVIGEDDATINDGFVDVLEKIVRYNKGIRQLTIYGCSFGETKNADIIKFLKGLEANNTIVEVNLYDYTPSNEGAIAIGMLLKDTGRQSSLKRLRIGQPIFQDQNEDLGQAYLQHVHLQHVPVVTFTTEARKSILKGLQHNYKLEEMQFNFRVAGKDFRDEIRFYTGLNKYVKRERQMLLKDSRSSRTDDNYETLVPACIWAYVFARIDIINFEDAKQKLSSLYYFIREKPDLFKELNYAALTH